MPRTRSREASLSGPAGHEPPQPRLALAHSAGPRRSVEELLTTLRKVGYCPACKAVVREQCRCQRGPRSRYRSRAAAATSSCTSRAAEVTTEMAALLASC